MKLQTLTDHGSRRPGAAAVEVPVLVNRPLGDRYWHLSFRADQIARAALPGQFLMISTVVDGQNAPTLPRPMAIYDCDLDTGVVDILYGVVGHGTQALSRLPVGGIATVIGPLGQPFDFQAPPRRLLVLGRGIGNCSLTLLARRLAAAGTEVVAVSSGRNPSSLIGADYYTAHGAAEMIAVHDQDGSSALEPLGRVLAARGDARPPDVIATCGSQRLTGLAVDLAARWSCELQVAVEAHMACGLGYCHGCNLGPAGADGREAPLVCTDGPVFRVS